MIFHVGLFCVYLLSLANAYKISEDRRSNFENCGFHLNVTCETDMKIYADKKLLAQSDEWTKTSTVEIPANTGVIEIYCSDNWVHGGIIASGDNGLKTDKEWECSPDNGNNWFPAYAFLRNGHSGISSISPDAEWIWTSRKYWEEGSQAVCQFELDTSSQCSVSPSPSSGFDLYATCFEKMKVIVDGRRIRPQSGNPYDWREAKTARIPSGATTLEIHCEDGFGAAGGILASSNNLITDAKWECSTDDGITWHPAFEVEPTGTNHHPKGISTGAKWIWSQKEPCQYSGSKPNKNVICRINLDGSGGSPASSVTVLPSKVNSEISSSEQEQRHCCEWRKFDSTPYKLKGVLLEDDMWKPYGCLDNCIFEAIGSEELVCFSSDDSECLFPSKDYLDFSQQAKTNRVKFLSVLDKKTDEYGNLPRMDLNDKLKYIRDDIRANELHTSEQDNPPTILMRKDELATMSLKQKPELNPKVEHYMDGLIDIYDKYDKQDDLVNDGLDPLKTNLKNDYYNEFQQTSHFLLQNTQMVSKIQKAEDNGGNDGINKFWDAVLANTPEGEIRRVKRSGCESALGNTLTSTATGCMGGLEGCAVGAIGSGVVGVASCVPDVINAIGGGCFAATSLVETMSGVKKISELVIGDFIRTSSSSEGFRAHFTEFLGWLDRQMSTPVEMLQVSTSQGKSTLTLTASHIVFTKNDTKYAEKLQPGDSLMHWNGTHIVEQEVTEIKKTYETGFWAPLTREGTLFVDGYLASCYASFSHEISDLAMTPVKAMPSVLLENEESQHKDGVRSVVKVMKKVGDWIGVRKIKKEANEFPALATDRDTKFCQFISETELIHV